MKQGRRFGFSAEQKLDVWRRWKAGNYAKNELLPYFEREVL